MARISGIVAKITFQNEESGFTVLRLKDEKTQAIHVCVGIMPSIECGESIAVRGEFVNNKRFGPQFTVEAYELIRPTTLEGIRSLLSSGLISGIGPHRAQKITDLFGNKTLDILDRNPEKLVEVPGIGKKRSQTIIQAWQRQNNIKDLMLFLQDFGITLNLVHKIYKTYGQKSKEVISSNPYRLIDDIWGVGFKKADALAQKLGFNVDSYRRIKAGIIFILQDATNEGHVYLPRNEVVDKAHMILGISKENIVYSMDHILVEKVIVAHEDRLYLPLYYNAETKIVDLLYQKKKYQKTMPPYCSDIKVDEWLQSYQSKTGWNGDPEQIKAVKAAIQNKIVLFTGGPGTGKTTTLHVLVSFFREHHFHVTLAAPTGRAAQRMGSISGLKAKTIHRLLEFNPRKSGTPFGRNKNNPIDTDILICDEVSMVDILLMHNLMRALRVDTAVIFVGDSNQLPSVGAGNILADLIESNTIPHVTLTTIFRQAATSRIVTAAHEIIHGKTPSFSNRSTENCFFLTAKEPSECLEIIKNLVTKRLPKRYLIDPIKDIQVLSPMHKGLIGTQSINRLLQDCLNTSSTRLVRGETVFSKEDKVMQIINNYDKNVFNGDIGYITGIMEDTGLTVDFGDKIVTYELGDLDELVHAYCISIHKSQGCEFNTVVIPVMTQHFIMLQRNLIYTALTRAKELCVLVGSIKALHISVQNDQAFQRYSRLAERLRTKCHLQS